ncbi:tripartite tricarboxylate transporter substrate binding protein [Roseomonas sp. NAR14]|uniref:Tripartite tricarboxylate transporter substrate binding protein n=1 Tax=Roseomonas acroporae TaxID=2937791 RepID=A0A9X2BVV7_9PROT|nr:tripartite tricarboxylate transporter substrate binding protein [Roseomonas acroporae]MCK8784409.1 tripartite tricarboxylate transporter substrate binding protein [Roseomonas acroporae]
MIRRRDLPALVAGLSLSVPCVARGRDAPVTLVAPFPAGTVTDNVARTVGQAMQETLGQPVIVENRAGAQGTLGAAHVARSAPDGQTLLVGSSMMFVARSLYRSLPYDPVESFAFVSGIGSTSMMLMVAPASPIRTTADLIAAAGRRDRPLTVAYGSPSGQLTLALFTTATGTSPLPVSYRGIPQSLTDLAGGHVDVAIVDLGSGIAQARAAGLRPIAISAARRSAAAPEVPTLQEAFPGIGTALETIIALQAPGGTPAEVVARLDEAVRAGLARPEVRRQFALLATTPLPLSAAGLADRVAQDNPRWEALIRQAGIRPE